MKTKNRIFNGRKKSMYMGLPEACFYSEGLNLNVKKRMNVS